MNKINHFFILLKKKNLKFSSDFVRNFLTVGILIGLLLLRYQLPFLVLFIFIPIFYFADRNKKCSSFLFWGLFIGVGFAFLEQSFVYNVDLFLYIGASIGYGIFYFTPMFLLLFLLKRFFIEKPDFLYIPVIIFSFWVYNFGYFPIVPFSFTDGLVHFPIFLQIIDLGGNYFLLFLIAILNFILYRSFFYQVKKTFFLIWGIIFSIIILYGWLALSQKESDLKNKEKIKVALIQGSFFGEKLIQDWQQEKEEEKISKDLSVREFMINRLLFLSEKVVKKEPVELIIWPEFDCQEPMFKEDGENGLILFEKSWTRKIVDFVEKNQVPVLISVAVESFDDPRNFYNSAVLIEPNGKFDQFYHKRKLIFFGENIPDHLNFLNQYKQQKGLGGNIISLGKKEVQIFKIKDKSFGVLICFENGFEQLSQDWKNKEVDFIVNLSNDALFESRRELNYQETASIFRAVENRIPFLRATNVGMTEIINSQGKIVKRLPAFKEGFLISEVEIEKKESFFSQTGHWFIVFQTVAFFLVLIIIKLRELIFTKKKESNNN